MADISADDVERSTPMGYSMILLPKRGQTYLCLRCFPTGKIAPPAGR